MIERLNLEDLYNARPLKSEMESVSWGQNGAVSIAGGLVRGVIAYNRFTCDAKRASAIPERQRVSEKIPEMNYHDFPECWGE